MKNNPENKFRQLVWSVISSMEGWCSQAKADRLGHYIIRENLSRCLEIGVYGGRSVVAMALAQQFGGLNGIVVGVDPWRNQDAAKDSAPEHSEWWANLDLHDIHKKCMVAIWSSGLAGNIAIVRNNSAQASRLLDGQTWDLVHIDGCHGEESALFDINTWVHRVNKGGLVVYDDLSWSTSGNAVELLKSKVRMIEQVEDCGFFRA